ncbi:MAG: hypothetical protein WDW38_010633 [Sanguina aurantia]
MAAAEAAEEGRGPGGTDRNRAGAGMTTETPTGATSGSGGMTAAAMAMVLEAAVAEEAAGKMSDRIAGRMGTAAATVGGGPRGVGAGIAKSWRAGFRVAGTGGTAGKQAGGGTGRLQRGTAAVGRVAVGETSDAVVVAVMLPLLLPCCLRLEPAEPGAPCAKAKTGGVYIPPFKLARMMTEVEDRSSPEYQRLTWEALKKSLNGVINKVNAANIKMILAEVFRENLVRGRGLFCRSMMKSQMASPGFSPIYSALVAVINTKFPELVELLLSRLILQFKRSYKRNDKPVCSAAAKFIAHLVNQGVANEVLALEMLLLMLENPTDDGVEMSVEFVKEVGAFLQEAMPAGLHSIFERFRAVLHEGQIDKRVQFIIEGLFAIRKAGFDASGFKAVKPELDLVEADDQITHELDLTMPLKAEMELDVFKCTVEAKALKAPDVRGVRIAGGDEDGGGGGIVWSDDGSHLAIQLRAIDNKDRWIASDLYEGMFQEQYAIIHRLETNKLRNIASLFAHMLSADALPWTALSCISLTEADTTSSSRIFIKYLFQELSSTMGLLKLNERLGDKSYGEAFDGVFPKTSPQDMRFSINFFTSIGLGGLTDRSRDEYKAALARQAQQQAALAAAKVEAASSSGSDSSSSDSSSFRQRLFLVRQRLELQRL